jgi:hypothetical protein
MARIEITGDSLVVHMTGVDVLLALRSTFTVPLADVRAVSVRPPDARYDEMKGLRVAGGYVPKSFAAGIFYVTGGVGAGAQHLLELTEEALKEAAALDGDRYAAARGHLEQAAAAAREAIAAAGLPEARKHWAFYDVHDPSKAIGIDVANATITRVVVEVDGETPEAAAERILAALPKG